MGCIVSIDAIGEGRLEVDLEASSRWHRNGGYGSRSAGCSQSRWYHHCGRFLSEAVGSGGARPYEGAAGVLHLFDTVMD